MRFSKEKIIIESIPLLTLTTFLEITGGQLLNNEADFIAIPFLLTTIPVINGLFGNIGTILGARLSTELHLGQTDLSLRNEELRNNIIQTLIVAVITILALTGILWFITPLTGLSPENLTPLKFMIIVLGAGIIMTLMVIIMSVISAFFSFKKGIDPDNTVAPVVTTTGDLMGITTLVIMVGLV